MTTQDRSIRGARIALLLLLLINLFNYIDRQVLSAVEVKIEETFFPEEDYPRDPETKRRLDKTIGGKMGALNTAFMATYMVIAPLFGYLADRMSRWLLVGIGVLLWSLASGASGLADSFTILFLTRCLVGVGEAAYGPVAPTILADLYPVEKRGKILSMFYAAIPVGSALGYVLGGKVTAWASGDWRWAFYVVVPPGLLLGIWCLLMKDPPRGQADQGAVVRRATWGDYLVMLKTPSYLLDTIGMTAMTFAMGGLAFFMPRYAVTRIKDEMGTIAPERLAEVTGKLLEEVNYTFGIIVVVSGLGATILGGYVGDKLKARFSGAYFLVSGMAMTLGFPFILAALWAPFTPFPWAWICIFLACFCLFFNTGPTNTILANVTHPSIRASAFALNILIIHALGDAISPLIIGVINDYTSMTVGFLTVSFMFLVAAAAWFLGVKHLKRDTDLAPTRLAS
jgi:MFS transporter, Spinster family, sphingosine-1-phosphate transporter